MSRKMSVLEMAAIGLIVFGLAQAAGKPHQGGGVAQAEAAVPVPGGGEDDFIRAILADLGAPATRADRGSLAAWFPHEFPSWPPAADYNPMASTRPEPGVTAYNTFTTSNGATLHVWNYPSASAGAAATARTLAGYPRIAARLRSGRGLCGAGLRREFRTWSGGGYSGVC